MDLLTYNIQHGRGQDHVHDLSRIVDLIRPFDLIALQEVERHWERSGHADQVAEILSAMPTHYHIWGPTIDECKAVHQSSALPPSCGRRQFGNLLLSRYPILWARQHSLLGHQSALHLNLHRGLIEAVVELPNGPIRIYVVHLTYPLPIVAESHITQLLNIVRHSRVEGPPVSGKHGDESWFNEAHPLVPDEAILLGDFNFRPGDPPYELLVGCHHPRLGRVIDKDTGLIDAWVTAGNAEDGADKGGNDATFHPNGVGNLGYRVDYCFLSNTISHLVESCEVISDCMYSDHFPLYVRLKNI
ncbi:endonuclease/exonuclease/phosphatase family protein [Mesorhizobium sp. M0293]|uniref:endonuclease/exonuclease/phosphatase family protein n=1 Tax=Mesorhizobium sp. M0293 TaxID=2956930 RepID=UPI0033352BAC